MNAHINRDLALAVVRACERTRTVPIDGSREEADYIHVNEILEAVEVKAMQQMARGVLKAVSDRVRPLDKKVAMVLIGWARHVAWENAQDYWRVTHDRPNKKQATAIVQKMDRLAERVGRGILFPPARVRGTNFL